MISLDRWVGSDGEKSVVGQVRRHILEDGKCLVHVLCGFIQRRFEWLRIGCHRVDDEPVLEAVVHHRVGAGMLELDGVQQTTAAYGNEQRITGGHNAIA